MVHELTQDQREELPVIVKALMKVTDLNLELEMLKEELAGRKLHISDLDELLDKAEAENRRLRNLLMKVYLSVNTGELLDAKDEIDTFMDAETSE